MFRMRAPGFRALLIRASLALVALCGIMAGDAQARIFVGIGFPWLFPPVVVAPPVYYPPYYPSYPPPAAYGPPGGYSYTPPGYVPRNAQPQSLTPPRDYGPPPRDYSPSGYAPQDNSYGPSGGPMPDVAQACHAGAYVCPLVEDTPPGGACACPGHGGQRIRGQAD